MAETTTECEQSFDNPLGTVLADVAPVAGYYAEHQAYYAGSWVDN